MTIPTSVYRAAKVSRDFSTSKSGVDLTATLRSGLQESEKGVFRHLWEYFKLTRAPGRLDLKDYYLYGLYDDSRFSFADKQEFVSERFYFEIIENCCDPRWWILADDKFWTYTVLEANHFPIPSTLGVFCASGRVFGAIPTLTNAEQLDRFLSERQRRFPIYAKPVNGIGSFGNFLIEGYEKSRLQLHDNSHIPLEQFVSEIDSTNGQLLQSTLTSHSDLADVCGRVSTVRVILIIRDGQPKILHTVWKIPASQNIADNFWRDGNMLASINIETGKVERVVAHKDTVPKELEPHSPAAKKLLGRSLPDWSGVIDLCTRGARLFSPLRFQSWDIALTESGPVTVELNPGSAFNLSQLGEGKGFLTDEFLEFLRDCGCKLPQRTRRQTTPPHGESTVRQKQAGSQKHTVSPALDASNRVPSCQDTQPSSELPEDQQFTRSSKLNLGQRAVSR